MIGFLFAKSKINLSSRNIASACIKLLEVTVEVRTYYLKFFFVDGLTCVNDSEFVEQFKDKNYDKILQVYREMSGKGNDAERKQKFSQVYNIISQGKDKMQNVREMGVCLG